MPRQRREDHPGAWHHVMNRGARQAPIFKLPEDCYGFLEILEEMVARSGIEVHAYSLMPNHYHLLVKCPLGNLSKGMQYLNGSYTLWLNARHGWDGPVFRGRFKSQLVMDEEYLRILLAYIHLNPFRARLVRRLSDEAWTSHRAYIGREAVPDWLSTGVFLDLLGGPGRLHEFVLSIHRGTTEYPEDFNPETGLFRKKAIEKRALGATRKKSGDRASRHKNVRHPRNLPADRVLSEVCRLTGASIADLKRTEMGPGANPARRFAIWALNRSVAVSQREIGQLLDVPYHEVTRMLGRIRKRGATEPVRSWIETWVNQEDG